LYEKFGDPNQKYPSKNPEQKNAQKATQKL
jgi:hypothetical protein